MITGTEVVASLFGWRKELTVTGHAEDCVV